MSRTIQTPISDLKHIRNLMERSRYFIGLSGLSGIACGLFGLAGVAAVVAYQWAGGGELVFIAKSISLTTSHPWGIAPIPFLVITATVVLVGALGSGYYFTHRRAIRMGYTMADPKTYKLIYNVGIPLAVGGAFCLALIYHAQGGLIGPATLIFYGLALINGSNFVSEDLRILGYAEIVLGLIACFFIGYGLHFWAIGFGFLHIGYGIWMYYKYDKHE